MLRSSAETMIDLGDVYNGLELYVMEGELSENGQCYGKGCWLCRPPAGNVVRLADYQLSSDARIWVKMNHL